MDAAQRLEEALVSLNRTEAQRILEEAATGSVASLDTVVTEALERIGERWDAGNLALSQVYMAGRICEQAMAQFESKLPARSAGPRIALAVLEDYHMLGKRLVASVLRSAGHAVLDYGRVTAEELVDNLCRDDVDVAMISVLMFPSALRVRAVVDGLRARGSKVKVVVGGAPFRLDPLLAKSVGADDFGRTASDALRIAAELTGAR